MKFTRVETPWIKFGKCQEITYVGRDVIATVSGIYVRFFDLRSRSTRIERFEGNKQGDGAFCIAGLSDFNENLIDIDKTVFLVNRVAICANSQEENGYACCAFAGTEYLLGQATFPNFRLIVWHWRTGDRMAVIDPTEVDLADSKIACSSTSPYMVARLAPNSGILTVYQMLVCSKIVRLLSVDATFSGENLVSFSWSPEGTLLLCDERGNICSVDFDEEENRHVRRIIEISSQESSLERKLMLLAHKNGVLVVEDEPVGGNRKIQAKFYRKSSKDQNENWRSTWSISLPSHPICAKSHHREDKILILVETGEIFEMIGASRDRAPRMEFLLTENSNYEAITPLFDPYFVALDCFHRLVVFDAFAGSVAPTRRFDLKHHGKITGFTAHPTLPILATCSGTGSCLFIEASPPFLLNIMLDFLIYEAEEQPVATVLILRGFTSGSSEPRAGNQIAIYSCQLSNNSYKTVDLNIKLFSPFESLHHGKEASREILGVPHLSKQLYRMELNVEFRKIVILDALPSLHQMRNVQIVTHREQSRFITCGYDGLIVVRKIDDPGKILAVFPAHHRSDGGAKYGIIVGNVIVSLGRNGDLVANKLPYLITEPDLRRAHNLKERLSSSGSFNFWISKNSVLEEIDSSGKIKNENNLEGSSMAETWMDALTREQSAAEEEANFFTRLSILDDLNILKLQVKKLLDANEAESPEAQLPVSAFDLDQETRERKLALAKMEEQRLTKIAEEQIARVDRAKSYLRERFLDPLVVPPRSIVSIFGESKVTNYPLVKVPSEEIDLQSWSRFSREVRELVTSLEEEDPSTDQVEEKSNSLFNLCGGYVDVLEMNAIAEERERNFKIQFNERFENTRIAKKVEMQDAHNRVERIRHCVNELRQTFQVDATKELLDAPQWHAIETSDNEFGLLLNSTTESHEERQNSVVEKKEREISTEDNVFRRETLESMMDGVLELKLEDKAKKIIPKPDCLLHKDPSIYTEEDVQAINSYKKRLQIQEKHRDEYKLTLENEIKRIKEEFQNGVKTFNDCLDELSAEKIRVERSILLEQLSKTQKFLGHRTIVRKRQEIHRIINEDLIPATREARKLAEDCDSFEAGVSELRNRYENLRKRDKLSETKFRSEFPELKQPMVEYLFRHYRRRPRSARTACATSLVFLSELTACVTGKQGSEILPREWVDYLRSLDELDEVPDGLPSRIAIFHWNSLCRLRRLKVEAETKVKSCALELAEAEQSLTFYRKACQTSRTVINQYKEKIQRLEKSLMDLTDDQSVQVVLKTRQLQKQPNGDLCSDWEDVILIPEEELCRVRKAVFKAGDQKLMALEKLVNLERKISHEEWRHSCVKMTMRNLEEDLKELETVKVSKIVRECCEIYSKGVLSKEETKTKDEENLKMRKKKLNDALEKERSKSVQLAKEMKVWHRKMSQFSQKIIESEAERNNLIASTHDPLRLRNAAFRRKTIRAISRRASLARSIRDNFEELLDLKGHLEVSKLRTYPTLKLKF